jgi:hypothetical protein
VNEYTIKLKTTAPIESITKLQRDIGKFFDWFFNGEEYTHKVFASGGTVRGRQHPFDGPELFDDEPLQVRYNDCYLRPSINLKPEDIEKLNESLRADFPYTNAVLAAKRKPEPRIEPGEGDWQLADGDDRVGEDID